MPHVVANAVASAIVSSLDVIARTTSTSAIIGAGLKKWMPHTLSGRPVSIAISTTGSVDVLVARIAWSGQMRSSSVKRCFLAARSSTIDSMHEIALGELAQIGDGADAAEHRVALVRLELAPVDLLGQRLLEPGDHRVGRAPGPGCAARPR